MTTRKRNRTSSKKKPPRILRKERASPSYPRSSHHLGKRKRKHRWPNINLDLGPGLLYLYHDVAKFRISSDLIHDRISLAGQIFHNKGEATLGFSFIHFQRFFFFNEIGYTWTDRVVSDTARHAEPIFPSADLWLYAGRFLSNNGGRLPLNFGLISLPISTIINNRK